MIKVGVVGAGGRMGQEVCRAVHGAADMELVAAIDPAHVGDDAAGRTIVGEVNALADLGAEVVVDFTIAEAVRHNVAHYAQQRVHAVIGTSGLERRRPGPDRERLRRQRRQRRRGGQLRHRRRAAHALLPQSSRPTWTAWR